LHGETCFEWLQSEKGVDVENNGWESLPLFKIIVEKDKEYSFILTFQLQF